MYTEDNKAAHCTLSPQLLGRQLAEPPTAENTTGWRANAFTFCVWCRLVADKAYSVWNGVTVAVTLSIPTGLCVFQNKVCSGC